MVEIYRNCILFFPLFVNGIPFGESNGHNFHMCEVKTQLHLMHKNFGGVTSWICTQDESNLPGTNPWETLGSFTHCHLNKTSLRFRPTLL